MLNLANKITIIRILLIPVFIVFLFSHIPYGAWLAVIVFTVAALSDGLDGYIARTQDQITAFGKFLDPLADKLLISAALVALVDLGRLSAWVAIVIIGREFAVSGLRLFAFRKNLIIPSSSMGKLKTFSQIVAIIVIIRDLQIFLFGFSIGLILIWIAVFLTVLSGIDYFIKARGILEKVNS
jgi:CDP-diacylglycerol--glycerol-3-phosphate 3-phosphatidyltransferase